MGLFSTPTQTPAPKPSPDGAFEAPNRTARANCWRARDQFFDCLERNAIIDSIKDKEGAQSACGEESKGFDKECASSWVCQSSPLRMSSNVTKEWKETPVK